MISTKEMREAEGKHIRITLVNGKIWEREYCGCYHSSQDEDEEPGIEVGKRWFFVQSEIEKLEILDE